jgi:hypothetical protein
LEGKKLIQLSSLKSFVDSKNKEPCATVAVLMEKSEPKKCRNGKPYQIWKLSDLKKATVSLFLFGTVVERLWTMRVGSVIIISNPKVTPSTDVSQMKFYNPLSNI